jgi:hypothetical protein
LQSCPGKGTFGDKLSSKPGLQTDKKNALLKVWVFQFVDERGALPCFLRKNIVINFVGFLLQQKLEGILTNNSSTDKVNR